jgi:hypothetical protein
MWQTEADVAAWDVTSKDDVSKMMLSHPLRGTKSKNEIARGTKSKKMKLKDIGTKTKNSQIYRNKLII